MIKAPGGAQANKLKKGALWCPSQRHHRHHVGSVWQFEAPIRRAPHAPAWQTQRSV